jgi:AcrR family transcriptional regulator
MSLTEALMTRITKDPIERKNEIIDVAAELFLAKGFEQTAVSDIVQKIGVAQGLFYYYFKSKDEVLDAVVERYAELLLKIFQEITTDSTIDATAKLRRILDSMFEFGKGKDDLVRYIHQESCEAMHQKLVIKMMEKSLPIFAIVFREGMAEGVFVMQDPDITAEILLTGLEVYLNKIVRKYWGNPEFSRKADLAFNVLEQALGAPKGSLQIKFDGGET